MNQMDTKKVMRAGGLFLIGVVLSVISWIILPGTVLMQFPGMQTGAPPFPKFLAILLAFAFSTGFSIASLKHDEGVKYAFIGYALHILYWVANL